MPLNRCGLPTTPFSQKKINLALGERNTNGGLEESTLERLSPTNYTYSNTN